MIEDGGGRKRFKESKGTRQKKKEINADSRQHERGRGKYRDYGYFSFAVSSQTNKPIVKPGN